MSNDEYKTSNDILGVETGPAASRSSIGYGRPPAKGQFKPGQSGNPRGRPRRRDIDLSVYLSKALDEQAPRNSLQKGKRRSNQLAFVQSLMDRALSGDGKALPPLMRLLLKADQFKLPPIPNDQHGVVIAPPEYWSDQRTGAHIGKLYYGTKNDGFTKVPFRGVADDYSPFYHGREQ